ncbi:MAG: hypothetical protein AAF573_20650 [Bacteroidota bacterium]
MNHNSYLSEDFYTPQSEQHLPDHSVLFVLGGIFGLWMLTAGLMIFQKGGYPFLNLNLFPLSLFIGGFAFTIYYQLRKEKTVDYLSNLTIRTKDTFVKNWFISAFIFPVVITLLFYSYSVFADALYYQVTLKSIMTFSPLESWSISYLVVYGLLQLAFLVVVLASRLMLRLRYFVRRILKFTISLLLLLLDVRSFVGNQITSFLRQQLTKFDNHEQIKTS